MTSVRDLAVALATSAVVLLGPPSVPWAEAAAITEPVVIVDGSGDGHGVGMSQDGALTMGRAGNTAEEILSTFYPGTEVTSAGGVVGVRVLDTADTRVEVGFPAGGEVRATLDGPQQDGFPVRVGPGGTASLSLWGGAFHATADEVEDPEALLPAVRLIVDQSRSPDGDDAASTTTTAGTVPTTTIAVEAQTTTSTGEVSTTTTTSAAPTPPPPPPIIRPGLDPAPRSGPAASVGGLWLVPAEASVTVLPGRDRAYRGVVEVSGSGMGGLLLVNRLDVEDYLRGMGEVLDPSWPPASLQAQAVAARTYALRATRSGATLCDDDRCQVYLGAQVEYPAGDKAVDASAGQVLTFDGALASTVYSASAGGITATPQEGFGTDGSDYPYLTSVPYAGPDPPVWSAAFDLSDLGRRLDYPGRVRGATVTAIGPSGRVLEIALDGDAGRRSVDGLRFASRMNLDSTLFSLRAAIGTAPSTDTGARGSIQAPPDAVGSLPPVTDRMQLSVASEDSAGHALQSVLLLVAAGLLLVHSRQRAVGAGLLGAPRS